MAGTRQLVDTIVWIGIISAVLFKEPVMKNGPFLKTCVARNFNASMKSIILVWNTIALRHYMLILSVCPGLVVIFNCYSW